MSRERKWINGKTRQIIQRYRQYETRRLHGPFDHQSGLQWVRICNDLGAGSTAAERGLRREQQSGLIWEEVVSLARHGLVVRPLLANSLRDSVGALPTVQEFLFAVRAYGRVKAVGLGDDPTHAKSPPPSCT
jgi:hypothetical protein